MRSCRADLCISSDANISKVAFVIDSRGGSLFEDAEEFLSEIEKNYGKCTVVFLDADSDILVNRYKESRRKHPLGAGGNLTDAISRERELLKGLKQRADFVVNTSNMKPRQLQDYIKTVIDSNYCHRENMTVNIISFGFKYGIPTDADEIYDVRFLPNPFYVPELKSKTGQDSDVADYVKNNPTAREYLSKLKGFAEFLMPQYEKEGRSGYTIAFGCTGGKHRSVTVANEMYNHILKLGYNTYITHRDINKDR